MPRFFTTTLIATLLLSALILPFSAHADSDVVRSISVTGFAEDKIAPDKAVVHVEVYTENKVLATAKAAQDQKVKQLMSIAGSKGIKSTDIRTLHANVQPQYDYVHQPDNTNKRVFRAYVLTNSIEITLRDLDQVGPVVDQLVNAKFDRINNVSFDLEDRRKHEEAMLSKALNHAKEKASMMASALGASIGKPISVSESGSFEPPILQRSKGVMMAAVAEDAGGSMSTYTPEGVIEIQKTVNVTFELE